MVAHLPGIFVLLLVFMFCLEYIRMGLSGPYGRSCRQITLNLQLQQAARLMDSRKPPHAVKSWSINVQAYGRLGW